MLQKLTFLLLICFSFNNISGQSQNQKSETFYVNVFIAANKSIYVGTEKTVFDEVDKTVSEIVRSMPFKIDQKLIYRIFADENLKHGFIMDVNEEMLSGHRDVYHSKVSFKHCGA